LKDQALLPGQAVQEVQLQLYPNPVTDKLNIRINGEAFLEQIEIYSANGVLMDRKMMKGNLQDGTVDCSSLVPGTYVLMAKTTRGNYPLKFIRQ
jgi:hypothetical protein